MKVTGLVVSVIVGLVEKARMDVTIFALNKVAQSLLDKIWPEVESMDFDLTQKVINKYKGLLCQQMINDFGDAHFVLQLLMSGKDKDIEEFIPYFTTALKLLEQPTDLITKSPSPVKKFFKDNWKTLLLSTLSVVAVAAAAWA